MSKLLHIKGSRNQILKTLPSNDIGDDGDIVVSTIQGRGIYLCIKANNRWYVSNKLEELRKIEKTSIKDLNVNRLKVGNTTITKDEYDVGEGNFTLDVAGDIELNADGGQVNIKDGIYQLLQIDPENTRIRMFDDANINDYFNIGIGAEGATTLSTVDADTSVGHLTLDADGDIILDAVCGSGTGIELNNAGTLFGYFDIHHSASHLKLFENGGASTDDSFNIGVYANGATTLSTIDAGGAAGHLTLDIDGSITLDPADGNYIAKNNGTEFSVANSAYAGMILGYRSIGEDSAHASYTLTTSYAVPHADMNISFKAPPSGNVKVFIQIYMNSSTSNKILYLGLSDNSTYNTIGGEYEHNAQGPDETDDAVIQHIWTITGLTAGTTYQYWLGAKTSGTNKFLNWGGNVTGRYCDFIMEVTALPAATADFAVYG